MYDNYVAQGADFYSFIIGLQQAKESYRAYIDAHPELHCTQWLYDTGNFVFWQYANPMGVAGSVPAHFIVDLDGNCRFGWNGHVTGGTGVLEACIDELL
jgi:hypothetical protein